MVLLVQAIATPLRIGAIPTLDIEHQNIYVIKC